MMNQIVLVGRLVRDIETTKLEDGVETSKITLAIPRSYKNSNGEYDTDFIECRLWNDITTNVTEYCVKGDLLAVKGRVQSRSIEKDNVKTIVMEIVAEKVTFLCPKKEAKNNG